MQYEEGEDVQAARDLTYPDGTTIEEGTPGVIVVADEGGGYYYVDFEGDDGPTRIATDEDLEPAEQQPASGDEEE